MRVCRTVLVCVCSSDICGSPLLLFTGACSIWGSHWVTDRRPPLVVCFTAGVQSSSLSLSIFPFPPFSLRPPFRFYHSSLPLSILSFPLPTPPFRFSLSFLPLSILSFPLLPPPFRFYRSSLLFLFLASIFFLFPAGADAPRVPVS